MGPPPQPCSGARRSVARFPQTLSPSHSRRERARRTRTSSSNAGASPGGARRRCPQTSSTRSLVASNGSRWSLTGWRGRGRSRESGASWPSGGGAVVGGAAPSGDGGRRCGALAGAGIPSDARRRVAALRAASERAMERGEGRLDSGNRASRPAEERQRRRMRALPLWARLERVRQVRVHIRSLYCIVTLALPSHEYSSASLHSLSHSYVTTARQRLSAQ